MRRALTLVAAVAAAGSISPGPARAADAGAIRGRVIEATTERPLGGVEVTLSQGESDRGVVDTTTVRTDKKGRYAFAGLATGADRYYTVDATYQGGVFPGRVLTLPDDTKEKPVIDTTLKVWPTTDDPTAIVIRRNDIFLVLDDTSVGVIESMTITNRSEDAYIGRGDKGDGAGPTLGFPLPASADAGGVAIVESELDIPAIVPADFGFAATIAIPPGEHNLIYSYEITGAGGTFDLTRTALYPTLEMSIFAEPPLSVEGNRVEQGGVQEIGADTYDSYELEGELNAGDPIQILATAGGSPTSWVPIAAIAVLVAAMLGAAALRRRRA